MTTVAVFRHFNRGKRRDIQTEHIRGVTRLKIQVSVPGRMRKVSFIFVAVGHIFTVTLALPVIDTAGQS